ncbi:MAG: sigma-54-dependent Fis family transcriptional regulator, partial [Deltaproteobacteria bacterium]|nr:sigma-54-dependent Fis family transcriptional regulator [Deltaproteobacteria bacterium]
SSDLVADKVGRFETANGGTLFLDEIGEISPALQVKLLRVLQDREFERVGSSRAQSADVRVIAATNRVLKEEMRAGRVREDLYYRLNVIPIAVPPLRERREDIPLLVDHALKSLRKRGLDRVRAVSPEAMRRLMEYRWPGNIRELENVLERAAVVSRGPVAAVADLPDEIREPAGVGPGEAGGSVDGGQVAPPSDERVRMLRALEENRWNRGAAAAALGMDRSTLWRKMKRFGVG